MTNFPFQRLGVNIDHVATLRNARGGGTPDPLHAALMAENAGANGITAHLREDRRHIRDDDMRRLKESLTIPLNFEMAATDEMVAIALEIKPNACCIVPEKREELTTEGGLDVASQQDKLGKVTSTLKNAGIRVSMFIDANPTQLQASADIDADIIELHTGAYCDKSGQARLNELTAIRKAARQSEELGLECHAGHGLSYETVGAVAAIPQIVELNIGHFLIGQSVFEGLPNVIHSFRRLMENARR